MIMLNKNKRNNANSFGCDDYSIINTIRNNNRIGIWAKWSNEKSTRGR